MTAASDVKPLRFSAPYDPSVFADKAKDMVFLPGFNGIPVRGAPNNLVTPQDIAKYAPKWDVHFRIFDLMDEGQRKLYEKLMTAAGTNPGWVRVFREERLASSGGPPTCLMAIKWGEQYLEPPVTGMFYSDRNPLGDGDGDATLGTDRIGDPQNSE